jgi:protein-S-isoprenylcysteine O-methyltransferase Ste14
VLFLFMATLTIGSHLMNIITTEKMMWLALALYWIISAISVKKNIKRETGWQRTTYILCVLLAFSLLFSDYLKIPFLYQPTLPQNELWKIAGLILCAAGLLFALTARIWLGSNWSGRITIKENHELVQSGPYRITRNPIYTGFLLAFCGCSMSLGLLKGYLGILLLVVCLLMKISKEESFMLEVFGDKWKSYKGRVKRLIPGIY